MNLQTHIKSELWKAIASTYGAENYSHAIVDAMHYLSDILREKTGVEGDGVSLVGQALGGDSPRLRVNKLQTETERNIQKGLEQILRGLYLAIRNPRSHEQVVDTKETADTIVCFINYTLGIIDKSEEPFVLSKFLTRVFDPAFVESARYAELLVQEIPANKRADTIIELYRDKTNGEGNKLKLIFNALYDKLTEDQLNQFLSIVSDELKITQDETDIRLTLQLLRSDYWLRIHEAARIRVENKLIQSMQDGAVYDDGVIRGGLGTWARDYLGDFTLRSEAGRVLLGKLSSNNKVMYDYVTDYFMAQLPLVFTSRSQRIICVAAIAAAITSGDNETQERLINCIPDYPEDWQKAFASSLKSLTNPERPRIYFTDGTPFLSSKDDDIPF